MNFNLPTTYLACSILPPPVTHDPLNITEERKRMTKPDVKKHRNSKRMSGVVESGVWSRRRESPRAAWATQQELEVKERESRIRSEGT